MKMKRLSPHIFYYPHQPELDRPMLAYIKGSQFSLAVDAGYSAKHVDNFYAALAEAKLEKPAFTAITHWHYDHTFGMHHISGRSIAHSKTNEFLREQQEQASRAGYWDSLQKEDAYFEKEYQNQQRPRIVLSDMEFQDRLVLRLGGVTALLFHTESPHSEDTVCVYIPEDGVLFLGDSTNEDFFNESPMDWSKLKKLVRMIQDTPCKYCVLSHAEPLRKEELLAYLDTLFEPSDEIPQNKC